MTSARRRSSRASRKARRCSTEASSDTILGHGWANQGYTATEIDPQARGVSWLRAEDGIPRRVKAAYLTDQQIIDLTAVAGNYVMVAMILAMAEQSVPPEKDEPFK